MVIACPECGTTRWWRPAEENERGVDIVDADEEVGRVRFEGRRFNREEGDFRCYEHDHLPPDDIEDALAELELEWI